MCKVDIFKAALTNSATIEAQYSTLTSTTEVKDHLKCTSEWIENIWLISINLKSELLERMLKDGKYLTKRDIIKGEVVNETGSHDENLSQTRWKSHQGEYYDRRILFDNTFENADKFRNDLADRGSVQYLTVMKHFSYISSDDFTREGLRFAVSDADSFIEAITIDDVIKDHIQAVFIKDDIFQRYLDYEAGLGDPDKTLENEYRSFIGLRDKLFQECEITVGRI